MDPIEVQRARAAGLNAGATAPVNGSGSAAPDASEAAGQEPHGRPDQGALDAVLQSATQIQGAVSRLIEIYADRMRASWRRQVTRIVLSCAAAIVAVVWLSAAALASLRGVCGGFTELLGGRTWLGDLMGGLLALLFAATVATLFVQRSSRRELVRLRAKYSAERDEKR